MPRTQRNSDKNRNRTKPWIHLQNKFQGEKIRMTCIRMLQKNVKRFCLLLPNTNLPPVDTVYAASILPQIHHVRKQLERNYKYISLFYIWKIAAFLPLLPHSHPHAEHPRILKFGKKVFMDNGSNSFGFQTGYRHRDHTAPWTDALNRFYNAYKNFFTIPTTQILMPSPGAFLTFKEAAA